MIAGAGLVMLAVKMMDKRPYLTFSDDSLLLTSSFGKKSEFRFDSVKGTPAISDKQMKISTNNGEIIIDLSPLTATNRTLFINTLTARLNTQAT
jgi:hypothetical protein